MWAAGQSADAPPDQMPSAAYNNIITPLDQIREDMRNWSQVEVDAYTHATSEANAACQRLEKTAFEGEELFSLARLCALAQNWPGAYSASTRYTHIIPAPHLIDAYEILCQADLNTNNVQEIPNRLRQLVSNAPFTPEVNQLFLRMIGVTQFISPKTAVSIALLLEPYLLHAISAPDARFYSNLLQTEAWKILILLHRNQRSTDENAFSAQLKVDLTELPRQTPATEDLPIPQKDWYSLLGHQLPSAIQRILPHTLSSTKSLLIVSTTPLQENSPLYRSLLTLQTQRTVAMHVFVLIVGASVTRNIRLRYSAINESHDATARNLSTPQGPVFIEVGTSGEILSITLGDPLWLDSLPIVRALLGQPNP